MTIRMTRTMRAGVSALAIALSLAATAQAQDRAYSIPAEPLSSSLREFARVSGEQIVFTDDLVRGKSAPALQGSFSADEALARILVGTDLVARRTSGGTIMIVRADSPPDLTADVPVGGGERVEDIVVTGSRIRGADPTVPVRAISREEIDRSGYSDVGSLVRSLPEVFGGGQNPGVMGSNTSVTPSRNDSNASTVNLRGLGSDATLVLFNGRRMSADSFFQAPDISGIPMDALARVEILKDGASAVYGSDAVAGVVNFILRDDFNGGLLKARLGGTTQGGGFEQTYSTLYGRASDRWYALASIEYSDQAAILAKDRALTSQMAGENMLSWPQDRVSAVVSGGVRLTPSLKLSVDGLYSDRSTKEVRRYASTSPVYSYGVDTSSYSLAFALEQELTSDWSASLTGVLSESQNERDDLVAQTPSTDYRNSARYLEFSASGSLARLAGLEVKSAFGGGFREEEFEDKNALTGAVRTDGDRNIGYVFGELLSSLVSPESSRKGLRRLDVNVSGRYEDYSDFGDTFNPRVGVRYDPFDGLAIRGTWGKSFKAPSFQQQHQASYSFLFPASSYGSTQAGTGLMTSGGNPNLKPERSESWTVTSDYVPAAMPSMAVSATYFHIDYTDRIVVPVNNQARTVTEPGYTPFVTYNPSPAEQQAFISSTASLYNFSGAAYDPATVLLLVENRQSNASAQIAEGLDFGYRQAFGFSTGTLDAFANATWLELSQQTTPTSPVQDLAGTLNSAPDFKARAGATWSSGGWRATGTINYLGESLDNVTVPNARIASWTTVDANIEYRFTEDMGWTSGLRLSLSARNLFDKDPPFVLGTSRVVEGQFYDSTNASPLGRFIAFQIAKSW